MLKICRVAVAAIVLGCLIGPAVAQTYPTRPIHVVVPWPPGAADVFVRIIQPYIEKDLGQPLIIENKPGANGMLGTAEVAKATPDGYTILFNVTSSLVVSPLVTGYTGFDLKKDLVPITDVVVGPVYLVIRNDLPVNSFEEFLAYAKSNPGKINIGSPGVGSAFHLLAEQINWIAGVKMTHVGYRGFVPMIQALQGGELQAVFIPLVFVQNDLKAEKLKAIAVDQALPSPDLLPVPDLTKTLPGFETPLGYALFMAPAGTPNAIIDRLNAAAVAAIHNPEAAKKLQLGGQTVLGNSRADVAAELENNIQTTTRLVSKAKAVGVKFTE